MVKGYIARESLGASAVKLWLLKYCGKIRKHLYIIVCA